MLYSNPKLMGTYNPKNPLNFSPVFWTDPTSYLSTYTLSGSNISIAGDLSSSNIPAVQASGGNQPTIDTTGINGKPAIKLVGASSQYLTANAVSNFVTGNDKAMCVFIVFRQSSQASQQTPYAFCSSSNNNPLTFLSQTGNQSVILRRADAAVGLFTSAFSSLAINTNYITCLNFNGTNADTYLNAVTPFLNENIDVNAMTVDRFSIGATARAAVTLFFNGWIGDVIVYNRYLSSAERLAVMQYLGIKWGVSVV